MPHLNWRSSPVVKRVVPLGPNGPLDPSESDGIERDFVMQLELSRPALRELADVLLEVLSPGGGELRVSLPDAWTVFWKLREDETRLLIAHPQVGEWVATVALEPLHAQAVNDALARVLGSATPEANESLSIGKLARDGIVSSVSNLELVIRCSAQS
jgi:hypothetical protein